MGGRELEKRTWLHFGITRPKKEKGVLFCFGFFSEKKMERWAADPPCTVMEGCWREAVPFLGSKQHKVLNLGLVCLSMLGRLSSWKEETRSSRPVVWFMKTLKKRVAGLRFCWSVLCQQTESYSGSEGLLEIFHQPCLGLGHPILLQGLQRSALALRKPRLHFREASSSS